MELLITNLFSALSILFFIVLVVRSSLSTTLNRSFLLFLCALLGWLIFNYLSNITDISHDSILVINRILFVVSNLAMVSILYFCLSIRGEDLSRATRYTLSVFAILPSLLSMTPLVVADVEARDNIVAVTFDYGALFYFIILGGMAVWAVARLLIDAIRSKGITRARARALCLAFGVGLGLLAITNVVLPVFFDAFYLSALGSLVSVVLLVGVGYSIVKYKLFDIRLFIARSLGYVFTITILALLYSVITFFLLAQFSGQAVSLSHELPYFAVAVLLGLTFQPMKAFFDKVSNRVFYKDGYELQDVLNTFNKLLLGEIRLNMLLKSSVQILNDALKFESGAIILNQHPDVSQGALNTTRKISFEKLKHHMAYAKRGNRYILVDDFIAANNERNKNAKSLYKKLIKDDINVIFELKTSTGLIGYLVLGPKKSGSIYTDQDIRLLTIISGELAVAVQNSLRFEEIQNFNDTLQEKVDAATHRLQRANARLRQLDATKDEFVSMASHQLRTPLTSIKGYLSMVLEGDAGKLNPTQEKLLHEAFTSSERMVRLIGDFLNVSRLRTGRFVLEKGKVNLADLVEGEVAQLESSATTRGLKLIYEKPENFPIMDLDKNKIQQVVMNFIDNALFYSKSGGKVRIELLKKQNEVILKVKDSGIGVPAHEKRRIFTKFYRASNARKQRPDGTGIGLFMAQKVIVAHGGSVIFESTEGKGSTFGFHLPIVLSKEEAAKAAAEVEKAVTE